MAINVFILFLLAIIGAEDVDEDEVSDNCERYRPPEVSDDEFSLKQFNAQRILQLRCARQGIPFIVGGIEARKKEFPHMAVVGFGASPDVTLVWQCGGSLISDQFVLTAAHCLSSREIGPAQKVKLGVINLDSNETLQEIGVSERIPHPKYKPPIKYNDIGLLKLLHVVKFTSFVDTACLNANKNFFGNLGTAIGFGKEAYDASKGSKLLMKVTLIIVPNHECNKSYSSLPYRRILPHGIIDSMLCAGGPRGGKDTCQGDSGGPFQTTPEERHCTNSLVGITSFGKFCGFANSPGVYTRVAYYMDWIESIVWS